MEEKIDVGNAIWEEMNIAKTYTRHIQMYNDKQRKRKRIYDYFMLTIAITLSIVVILSDEMFRDIAAYVAIVSMIVDKIKEPFKLWFQPEEDISKLDNISNNYALYLTHLEELYTQLLNGYIQAREACTQFYKLKSEANSYSTIVNKYMRFANKNISRLAQDEAEQYLTTRFNCNNQ